MGNCINNVDLMASWLHHCYRWCFNPRSFGDSTDSDYSAASSEQKKEGINQISLIGKRNLSIELFKKYDGLNNIFLREERLL